MSNIQEVKVLVGRMDRENSPETMDRYDYIEAHNIRTVGNDESDSNYLTNLEGNVKITVNLPEGQSRCVGSESFENVSKAYFVRFNSRGYHQIVEFNYDTNVEQVIFENITDSEGGLDIFKIDANTYFSDIKLVHDRFLVLNDGVNEIFCLDLNRFGKGLKFSETDLFLIKQQPESPAKLTYANNTIKSSNALRGNLFQFRYQYGYEDFRESSWSTVSKRQVPINEQSNGQGQSVSYANSMIVRVKVDAEDIEELNIAVRIGNGNWLLARSVSKERLLQLASSSTTDKPIPFNSSTGDLTNTAIQEIYDPVQKIYEFVFYNDGLYPVLDQLEVDNPYDAIPQKAEAVEVVNGNILALGGITEGYDRPELETVSIDTTQYAPNLSSNIVGGTDFDFSHVQNVSSTQKRFYFKGSPKQGDVIYFRYKQKGTVSWSQMDYVVTLANQTNGLNNTVSSAYNKFKNTPNPIFLGTTSNYMYTGTGSSIDFYDVEMYVVRVDIGYLNTQSINTLKTNSSYQLALAYFDRFGRRFPIVTDERFIIDTPSLADTRGLLSQVNWNIQQNAPEGATSYQWLISENQKYQDSIYLTGKLDSSETTENYIAFEMKSLERFLNNEKESQVNYTFTKGDKVVLVYTTNGSNSTVVDWFRYPFIELDIVDFTVKQDPSTPTDSKYILRVRNTNLLRRGNPSTLNWLNGKDIMMELYTPKKRDIETENIVFYEIGEQYPIVDGKHTVTSGNIRTGDWYYKGRLYESTINDNTPIAYEVEDPNFSDNYESKYWSAGRARTYNDEQGKVEKKASIRYSDEYIYGSKYNGISRFYLERIYGEFGGQTTSKYGWIRKLQIRNNSLVCIQEFKVGIIPVYMSIWHDQSGTSTVAVSDKIFDSVQYRSGNYGCGTAKESISATRDGLIYFFDNNNCLPIRDSLSGLDVIDINMTSYFIKYAKEAKDKGAKFIGYYDNHNKEWNLTIEESAGRIFKIVFSEGDIIYRDVFIPLIGTVIPLTPAQGTLTLSGNMATYTPNLDYVGTDEVSFSFPTPNGVKVKKETINVIAGDNVPAPFSFPSKTNQPLATLVESSSVTVADINMPAPMSITGGEYSKNGGAWSTAPTSVVSGDSVKVRHLTSSSYESSVTTTLTIGGVNGTFNTTTVPENTSPDRLEIWANAYIDNDIIKISLNVSHALNLTYTIRGFVNYNEYGTPQVTPDQLLILPAGQTSAETDTGIMTQGFATSLTYGELILSSSSLLQGSLVTTQDSVTRVVHINESMNIL